MVRCFIDTVGILRVGGRLQQSALSYNTKHPILPPKRSRLTLLTIGYYHIKYLHAGFRTLQFLISQTFWILSFKCAIRSVLTKCIVCWKTKPKSFVPLMGSLPIARVSEAKAFLHSGVDYGGPFK